MHMQTSPYIWSSYNGLSLCWSLVYYQKHLMRSWSLLVFFISRILYNLLRVKRRKRLPQSRSLILTIMKAFIFLICALPHLSYSQKICYEPAEYQASDIPCDPGAVVSACCKLGATCATNLYCISPLGAHVVGTCTDRSFTDPACPWRLNKTTASTNFDHFDYKLNTTTCPDQTICPSDDPMCCSQHRGKIEIEFHNNAAIPSAKSALVSYYSAASYTSINLATTSQTSARSATIILTNSTTTSTKPTTPTDSSGLAPSSKQSNKTIQPRVGVVIGIVIALCLSLPLVIILYSRHCSRRRNGNDPEISSHKISFSNERLATPNDEIAAAVRIDGLNELPDSGRRMLAEMDVRRQTRGGEYGPTEMDVRRQTRGGELRPAEMEFQDHTGGVVVPNKV